MMEQMLNYLSYDLEYVLRMVIAALCGGVIGYERSRRKKEAGLRTHIIVAVGSALLMIVSKYGFMDVLEIPGMRVDAARIASNVITGISFLGAGVIFIREASIKGLTTAAGLWAMAGVGLAIGAGMYGVGIFATLLIMVIQIFTHGSLQKLDGPVYDSFSITYKDVPDGLEVLHETASGRLKTLIVRGTAEEISRKAAAANPDYFDVLPLSLEEIFIYELGGVNYAVKDIIL